jgi:DNA-directed RNA polymerase subunit E'/Rpb7
MTNIFLKSVISKKINIPMNYVNNDIKNTLSGMLIKSYDGICIADGYIKPNSINIVSFSSGLVNANNIIFDVVFECDIFNPVEGMYINCSAVNITKAGIRAESNEFKPTPFVMFIARDHNYNNPHFSNIKIGQNIKCKVIGQRFELNDKFISIIAEVVINKQPTTTNHNKTIKQKINPKK